MNVPMKLVGGRVVPLTAEELAARSARKPAAPRKRPEFHPVEQPVTRAEFDALASKVAGLEGKKPPRN